MVYPQIFPKHVDPYQQCTRCVMDTSAAEIRFDSYGVCSFCTEFLDRSSHIINESQDMKDVKLDQLVRQVRDSGKGKPYDCIVGVSGGVDSSWTLVQVKKLGLRPLAVHMDNGWNSELAQSNIANLVRATNVDLYTHVINWTEYRELMNAFFAADVVDVELLYDNAMIAVNYQQAARYGLKYILAGTNQSTEGMRMPRDWNWFKFDKRNIQSIALDFGPVRTTTFPSIGVSGFIWNNFVRRITWTSFLDYLTYNKNSALEELEKYYDYKRYPYKHYESIFTRFYQGYILPRKFGVDKRKIHFSTLVASGQMSREEALEGLVGLPYTSELQLESDLAYFLKKMKWSESDLDNYISRPGIPHNHYSTERPVWELLAKIHKKMLGRSTL